MRLWEFTVLASVAGGYLYWYLADQSRFSLGIYGGFCLCFGWTWLFDLPFLLNLSFDSAAIGGFTWAGHWEPLWTAFSYAALGVPMVWYNLRQAALVRRLGLWRYPVICYGVSIPVQLYEGWYGAETLGIEQYHWRPAFLVFHVPITNALLLVPLMLAGAMLFIDAIHSLGSGVDALVSGASPPRRQYFGHGRWASLLAGFAVPQAGFYLTFLIVMPILQALAPWTGPVKLQ